MQKIFWLKYIVYPFLGSFVGYITNWIAIKLLFHPKKKIFGIQGLLEKRKDVIAKTLGELVREYLLNTKELSRVVHKDKVKEAIQTLVDKTLYFIPSLGRRFLQATFRKIIYFYFFDKEGYIKEDMLKLTIDNKDLERIIEEKIMSYDITQIEKIVNKASGTEINFILISGAVLGFIVGLIEVFLPI